MLKEVEGGRGEEEEKEEFEGAAWREPRAEMTAIAEAWQRWRERELKVVRADFGLSMVT